MDHPETEQLLERLAEDEFAIRHLGGSGAATLFQSRLIAGLRALEGVAGREEAQRLFSLAIEKKRQQDIWREAWCESNCFINERGMPAIWQEVWSDRDLSRTLLLFEQDGRYQNADLQIDARGQTELRRELGLLLHGCDARLRIDSCEIEQSAAILLKWTRYATRVPGILMRQRDVFSFGGKSLLRVRRGKIQDCEEHWDMRHVLKNTVPSRAFQPNASHSVIRFGDTDVVIGSVRVSRRL